MEQLNFTSLVASNTSSSSPGRPPHLVPVVLLSICFLLGVPGNIAVVLLRSKWQHLSSLSQTLMLNLALSDLLCLLMVPLWIYTLLLSWNFSLAACKLMMYLMYCSVYGSHLTVMMMSVQRYLLVVRLKKSLHLGRKRLLVLLWLVVALLSIPSLVVPKLTTYQNWTYCNSHFSSDDQRLAALLTELLVGFISLSVVVFAYIHLRRKVNQTAFFNNPQTSRLVTSIIMTFFVLWVPYHTVNVLHVFAISLNNKSLLKFCTDTWEIVGALILVNSCLNPLLYAFASKNMRQKTTTNNATAATTDEELQQ